MLDLQRIRLQRCDNIVPNFRATQLFQVLAQRWPGRSSSRDFGARALSCCKPRGALAAQSLPNCRSGFLQSRRGGETGRREVDLQKQNARYSRAKGFLLPNWQIAIRIPMVFSWWLRTMGGLGRQEGKHKKGGFCLL